MSTNFKTINKEIMNRIGSHWMLRTNKDILEKWGQHPLSLSNWNKTGIPEGILALFAIKENVNYEWLVHGTGEKDKMAMPTPNLLGLVTSEHGDLASKIWKSFEKVPDEKKEEACKEVISVIVGYYV